MATNDKPRPLSAVIGERLREFRASRGLRQEDIAGATRNYGFTWGRSSVAALEAGNRELSVEELFAMPSLIRDLGGWDEPLIPSRTKVQISESAWIPAHQLPMLALSLVNPVADANPTKEEPDRLTQDDLAIGAIENQDMESPEYRRRVVMTVSVYEYIYYLLWPDRIVRYRPMLGSHELDRRVAERLSGPGGERVSTGLVEAFALGLYGHSLGAERDARTDSRGIYESKRALQSARGHVTRELIDELQEEITRRWQEIQQIMEATTEEIATDKGLERWEEKLRSIYDERSRRAWDAEHGRGSGTPEATRRRRFSRRGK